MVSNRRLVIEIRTQPSARAGGVYNKAVIFVSGVETEFTVIQQE